MSKSDRAKRDDVIDQTTSQPVPPAELSEPVGAPRPVPNRGTRKRVLGEGEGDYCIYELVASDSGLPKGSMIPLPTIPRFVDTVTALKWIRNESGDLLAGKQVAVVRFCEILSIMIQAKPTVVIASKPKITVKQPETSSNG